MKQDCTQIVVVCRIESSSVTIERLCIFFYIGDRQTDLGRESNWILFPLSDLFLEYLQGLQRVLFIWGKRFSKELFTSKSYNWDSPELAFCMWVSSEFCLGLKCLNIKCYLFNIQRYIKVY
eukprot:TRINITY_DN295_c0_g1_i4.p4 TRINITY_DN295_c0_g1~~TRINITY_DN295_c0_g1_i4.p4  ORF type:complete len:121 (+),score=4.08 TRINITY_DN295_c0_g1_i4:1003-1365(+)